MLIVGTIETEAALADARPDTLVLDADGDTLFKGRDGHWHYPSDVREEHEVRCYLPATVIRPEPQVRGFQTHCWAAEGCDEELSSDGEWPMPPLLFRWLNAIGWGVVEDKLLCPEHLATAKIERGSH